MPDIAGGLMVREAQDVALSPIMDLAVAKQKLAEFQSFVKDYLREGEDFGKIPGTPKPTLYKPGADKLCELYGLADDYEVVSKVEDFDRGLFDYTIKCSLLSKRGGFLVATGMGSCNSFEGKYRYREGRRVCPECGKETIIKGKEQYGGGWLCYAKKGGCGAKWPDGASEIESQETGKTLNDDIATQKNTILKMAKKRAKVDATLAATRSSGIFTQDVEDMVSGEPEQTKPAGKSETIFFGGRILADTEDEERFYYEFDGGVVFSPKATDDGRLADKVGQTAKLKVFKRDLRNGVQFYELYEVVQVGAGAKPAAAKSSKQQNDSRGKPFYEESPDGKEARFRVSSVKEDVSKKNNNPYLRIEYGLNRGESVFCFDTKLMDEIRTWMTGDVVTVALETSGNYRSITRINAVERGQLSQASDQTSAA